MTSLIARVPSSFEKPGNEVSSYDKHPMMVMKDFPQFVLADNLCIIIAMLHLPSGSLDMDSSRNYF